jgi:hypothetical protein
LEQCLNLCLHMANAIPPGARYMAAPIAHTLVWGWWLFWGWNWIFTRAVRSRGAVVAVCRSGLASPDHGGGRRWRIYKHAPKIAVFLLASPPFLAHFYSAACTRSAPPTEAASGLAQALSLGEDQPIHARILKQDFANAILRYQGLHIVL